MRPRYTRGVLIAASGEVRSGTTMVRISRSSIPPLDSASTVIRNSSSPGVASNTSFRAADRDAGDGAAGVTSGDRPRNTRSPSIVAAMSDTPPRVRLNTSRAGRLRERLPEERDPRLARLATGGPKPRPHVLVRLHRRGDRGQRLQDRLRRVGNFRRGAHDVRLSQRPIPFPRAHVQATPPQSNCDRVELAIGRRLRRVVPDQVVEAGVAHDLRETGRQVVTVDNGAAVGFLGQHAQRVLRHQQTSRILPRPDGLVNAEFEGSQPTRVERIDGGIVTGGRRKDPAHVCVEIRLREEGGGVLPLAVLAGQRANPAGNAQSTKCGVGAPELRR